VPKARPYDLRHSFVSLLIAQGASVVEVAAQAGHAPTMTLDTYAHLFDESKAPSAPPQKGSSGQHELKSCPRMCPFCVSAAKTPEHLAQKTRANSQSRRPDSNRGPLHYE
jgi:hypothetical protein